MNNNEGSFNNFMNNNNMNNNSFNNSYSGNNISNDELNKAKEIIANIEKYYEERIVGQKELFKYLLVCLLANGHILLESVPGLAKTTAAKVLTDAVQAKFSRIQCTPDLLPSDIIGTQIFNYANNNFQTKIGPINANFVLLDEVNRSSAKTQSATLEAMQERQITIDNQKIKLPKVFIVIATQNPIEQEGTYALAEAQLDRFLVKEVITYPTPKEEVEVLNRIENNIFVQSNPIYDLKAFEYLQEVSKKVYIDNTIKQYITLIIDATRNPGKYIDKELASYVEMGSSTRGCIAFMECSKALALMKGRNYVTPDDIKELRYGILRHRVSLNFSAIADNVTVERVIDAIFDSVRTP